MSFYVMLIVLLLIAGVVVALVWQLPTEFRPPKNIPEHKKYISVHEKSSEPDSKELSVVTQSIVPLDSEAALPVMYKDLRAHLQSGIEKIFESSENATDKPAPALLRAQVDERILEEALLNAEGMDQFRTEQIKLQQLLNDPASQLAELSQHITADPVLTAKVLKLSNSAYFGISQKIDSINHALMLLGLQNIKNILYREGLRGLFDARAVRNRAVVARIWRHSNLVCICAQHFSDLFEGMNRGTLFTLGIVHDIGKLILMDRFGKVAKKPSRADDYPLDIFISEEDQLFGVNHAVIGGCILENWKFSDLMVQAVMMHHAPSFMDMQQTQLPWKNQKYVVALFLADQVARMFNNWNEGVANVYPLHASYWGLVDRKKFATKILDINFLNQMRAAEMLALSEHPAANAFNPSPSGKGNNV